MEYKWGGCQLWTSGPKASSRSDLVHNLHIDLAGGGACGESVEA